MAWQCLTKDNSILKSHRLRSVLLSRPAAVHICGEAESAASCGRVGAAGGQSSEIEMLKHKLAAVTESRAAEINEDNIRLINQLSEVL